MQEQVRYEIVQMMNGFADLISNRTPVPLMNMRGLRHADGFPDVKQALAGEVMRNMWRNPRGSAGFVGQLADSGSTDCERGVIDDQHRRHN